MACECQSGERRLVLSAPGLSEQYPELVEFSSGRGWSLLEDEDRITVQIGGDSPWTSVADVVGFLRTVLDMPRLWGLRAAWLSGRSAGCAKGACGAQGKAEVTWVALAEMSPLDSTPLVSMLKEQRIETWFQPVFRASDLGVWGYECLMRGRDEQGDLVMPGLILDWAKQEHLTFMLDRICRETHIRSAGQAELADEARVLVNFLPTAIYEPSFCLKTTMKAAKASGLKPGRIIFEVVESENLEDREHLTSVLGYYRRSGFGVALDDVGAGYAGLMLLADLNPDLIKIDRGLVVKACESKMHGSICKALCNLAHESGKLALAEGVETVEQWQMMDRMGVDLFQGYLFGKPDPEPAREALVTRAEHFAA